MVSKLLECGADPQRYTPSPLCRAVEDDHQDIVSVLLKRDVRSQKPALKLAALRGNYSMVEFLLRNGLDASEHGNASLYVAERKGYKDMANLLKLHVTERIGNQKTETVLIAPTLNMGVAVFLLKKMFLMNLQSLSLKI
ncbi:unnamed protein product [Penicillium manginii]